MNPCWNFLPHITDATLMPNRKGFRGNYEVVFPKLSAVEFFIHGKAAIGRREQERESERKWHASRRPEIYEATTTSLEHAPGVNYFPPEATVASRCCVGTYISREVTYRFLHLGFEGITYDNCHERSAIAHLCQIHVRCYPILSFNPLN